MGLKCMTRFIKDERLMKSHQLRDTTLIVDGSCCSKWSYHLMQKDPSFGSDYEDYAKYIRRLFTDFQECKVRCYVVFDGGHNELSMQKKLDRMGEDEVIDRLFLFEVVAVILKELNVPYVVCCTEEADDTIVALARYFNCPILSNDSDFFLTKPPLILFDGDFRNPSDHFMKCEIFERSKFLQRFNLKEEKLPVLSLLLQSNYFEYRFFDGFFRSCGISTHVLHRISGILKWLSVSARSYSSAVDQLLQHVPMGDRQKCCNMLAASKRTIFGAQDEIHQEFESVAHAFKFLVDPATVVVNENDPEWFEKGVVMGNIAKSYIDMFKMKKYVFSPEQSFWPCRRILRYAFDLLKGFTGETFQYIGRSSLREISGDLSIGRPEFNRRDGVVPFSSGWISLPDYFGHFVRETLPGLPEGAIEDIPADCRLWMLALVWWRTHAARDALVEAHCLLLCRARAAEPSSEFAKIRPSDNFDSPPGLTSLAQFHHTLHSFDSLSKLCVAPYERIRFHEVYCESFLRGVLEKMTSSRLGPSVCAAELVRDAPTIIRQLYENLLAAYERCVEAVTIVE